MPLDDDDGTSVDVAKPEHKVPLRLQMRRTWAMQTRDLRLLAQQEGHFVQDCDHVWGSGPNYDSEDGCIYSVTCECGAIAIYHGMAHGP